MVRSPSPDQDTADAGLLPVFIRSRQRDAQRLALDLEAGRLARVGLLAAAMGEAGRAFHLAPLVDVAKSIEEAARHGDRGAAVRHLDRLFAYLETLAAGLEADDDGATPDRTS